jgi:hypothetical protein
MQRCLLFSLLVAIVTGLAQCLQVGLVPEQALITAMRNDVIANEQRCIAFELTAPAALIQITEEDGEPQRLPSRRLIPAPPRWRRPAAALHQCYRKAARPERYVNRTG